METYYFNSIYWSWKIWLVLNLNLKKRKPPITTNEKHATRSTMKNLQNPYSEFIVRSIEGRDECQNLKLKKQNSTRKCSIQWLSSQSRVYREQHEKRALSENALHIQLWMVYTHNLFCIIDWTYFSGLPR